MIQTEKDFESMWNRMDKEQREMYATTMVMEAFSHGKITHTEAIETANDIKMFATQFNAPISIDWIKLLKVITSGGIRFTIVKNHFIAETIESAKVYVNFVSALPVDLQIKIKNDAISLLYQQQLLTTEEANEALADTMKMSIFENYDPKSDGSIKVNKILEKVFCLGECSDDIN
jgi:hypothetical protein